MPGISLSVNAIDMLDICNRIQIYVLNAGISWISMYLQITSTVTLDIDEAMTEVCITLPCYCVGDKSIEPGQYSNGIQTEHNQTTEKENGHKEQIT